MSTLEKVVSDFGIPSNWSLVLATAWIIVSDFAVWSRSPVLIAKYAETKSNLREYNDFLDDLLPLASAAIANRFVLESDVPAIGEGNPAKFFKFKKNSNEEQIDYPKFAPKSRAVWFIDGLKAFRRLENDLNNDNWHYQRNGYFCMIYTGQEIDRLQTIETMFQRLFIIYVMNVIVFVNVQETVLIYTYFPYTEKRCLNTEPVLFNYYGPTTNYSFKKPKLFNKKVINMWRCPLAVTTWENPPFVYVENDKSTGEFKRLDGIEGKLMMLLADQMNFTIRLVVSPGNERGHVFPNGTVTGALGMLQDQETNITITTMILTKERSRIAQPAHSYMSTPIGIGVPKGRYMSPFQRIMRPFKFIIWTCLSSSVVIAIFIIYTFKAFFRRAVHAFLFGSGNRTPFTNLWSAFYGGSLPSSALPQRNFARYLLAVWLLYTLILRTAYTGQLFLILQDTRARSSLSTVDEALAGNLTFYTYPGLVSVLKSASTDIDFRFMTYGNEPLNAMFKQLATNENANAALTIMEVTMRLYNQEQKNRKERINILRQPLFMAPLTFYMPKNSYLTNEINELLLRVVSTGLISKFEKVYLDSDSFSADVSHEPAALSLWLLMGLFSIYATLIFLSTLVFLLELWSKRSPTMEKLIDFLNF